jgi:hypothetical protein
MTLTVNLRSKSNIIERALAVSTNNDDRSRETLIV